MNHYFDPFVWLWVAAGSATYRLVLKPIAKALWNRREHPCQWHGCAKPAIMRAKWGASRAWICEAHAFDWTRSIREQEAARREVPN